MLWNHCEIFVRGCWCEEEEGGCADIDLPQLTARSSRGESPFAELLRRDPGRDTQIALHQIISSNVIAVHYLFSAQQWQITLKIIRSLKK